MALIGISQVVVILVILGSQTSVVGYRSVKASQETEYVGVTVEACGINGFRNTTVRLTKQQYENLEAHLSDLRARLNQTRTREEAVPVFNEAIVELANYGLLPKKMSIQQAQELIFERPSSTGWNHFLGKKTMGDDVSNIYCLTYLTGTLYNKMNIWTLIGVLLNRWAGYHLLPVIVFLVNCLYAWAILKPINLAIVLEFNEAQLFTMGFLGIKHCDNVSNLGVFGFVGLQITTNFKEAQITCLGWSYSTELIYTPD
ncbi:MAG: hypothetical protein IMZ58_12000 [Thermoplasmata archaeon]|nr:hypothetical protein [Thermoplasmata archaeon]